MSQNSDVVVVGAGPAGLMLASELALAGVRVRVFEQRAARSEQSRALTLHPRSLEVLAQRGLVERFLARGVPVPGAHFAVLDTRLDLSRLATRHPFTLFLPQAQTEALLEARALELGVELLREHAVIGLEQDDERVVLRVRGPAGERVESARYVVGCDGSRSVVRGALGVEFVGTDTRRSAMLGDVALREPPARPIGVTNERGLVLLIAIGEGLHRIVLIDPTRAHVAPSAPLELEELSASLTRVLGTDFGMHAPRWLSRFGDATRVASRYRVGRVLLAGDAAHIHFPAGGQGLNVGLQDAMNLGWKLAATVQGWAPAGLLDSYHAERHPVGVALARNTAAQCRLMDFTPEALALRALFDELLALPEVQRKLAGEVCALDVHYPPGDPNAHPLIGQRLPDLELGARRLYESLHGGRFVVIDPTGDPGVAEVHAPWRERAALVRASVTEPRVDGPIVVRPDGHVAWTGEAAGLGAALTAWCGAPPE